MATLPPTLYAGNTNATGMQVPVGARATGGPIMSGAGAEGSMPTLPVGPVTQNPVIARPGQMEQMGVSPSPSTGVGVQRLGAPGQPTSPMPGTPTGSFSGLTSRQASRVLGENQNYYGEGMGALLTNYLQTGAGYNSPLAQQMVKSTDVAMQQQINQQYGDLQQSLASAGISPDSSTSALASSQFLSNASAQENLVAAQQYTSMYQQSQQNYLTAMLSMAGINAYGTAHQQTAWGAIGSLLSGGVGGLAGYLGGSAGMAGNVSSSGGFQNALGGFVGNLPGGESTTLAGALIGG